MGQYNFRQMIGKISIGIKEYIRQRIQYRVISQRYLREHFFRLKDYQCDYSDVRADLYIVERKMSAWFGQRSNVV